jgi:hypothetical protein
MTMHIEGVYEDEREQSAVTTAPVVKSGSSAVDIHVPGDGLLGYEGQTRESLAGSLVNRLGLIEDAWVRIQGGDGRTYYDAMTLNWIRDMYAYYHLGGGGCPATSGGSTICGPTEENGHPTCWYCAGGTGLPPLPESVEAGHDLSEKEQQAADITRDVDTKDTLVIRISGIGDCRRMRGYTEQGVDITNPPKERWTRAAKMGDALEPIMVDWVREQGDVTRHTLDEQVTVEWAWPKGGLLFRGHPDGDVWQDTQWINLEFKAPNTDKAQAMADQGVQNVDSAYYDQAHGYMRAKGQSETMLVILDRNSGEIYTEGIPFDKAHWKTLVDRWLEVAPIILAKQLPERDFSKGSFRCGVCRFRDLCWNG